MDETAEPGEAFVLVVREMRRVPINDYQLGPGEVARATVDIAEARPVAVSGDVRALREAMGELEAMRFYRLRDWGIVRVPVVVARGEEDE